MTNKNTQNLSSNELMKSVIQRIATGPELSKDISRDEAKLCMTSVLKGEIDETRAAIFLIALRMKRETDDEVLGVHDAIKEITKTIESTQNDIINIGDPYDGFTRNVPSSAFLLPVLAEIGYPTLSHGVKCIGPKFGCTHNLIFELLGHDINMSAEQAAERLEDKKTAWAYLDQSQFCPELYGLMDLRERIIKRPVITTVEVLANPIVGKKTHFVTGYVHKAYPPVYLNLSRNAGFDTAMAIRGTEGGVIPTLKQNGKVYFYKTKDETDEFLEIDPIKDLDIHQNVRAVEIPGNLTKLNTADKIETKVNPKEIATESVKLGLEALSGKDGPMKDCIIYGASIILHNITNDNLSNCRKIVTEVVESGSCLDRIKK
tara:strand:- start:5491 stop:6612 length:1122 start_codon:yes stop_codon:yes gene_type:complete